jgi:hypothetical protein
MRRYRDRPAGRRELPPVAREASSREFVTNVVLTERLRPLAFTLGLALACGAAAFAAPTAAQQGAGTGTFDTPDYRIQTSETHYNMNTGVFTMPHRVRFFRPGTDATSARAEGNSKLGTATLIGDVVVHDSGNASEAGTGDTSGAYHGGGPATLTCDKLDVDTKQKLYIATGNVHFSQGARSGSASKATLNRGTGMLHLEGSVHLSDAGSTATADIIDYNMNTRDVDMHGSPATLTQPANRPIAPESPSPKPKPKPMPKRKA